MAPPGGAFAAAAAAAAAASRLGALTAEVMRAQRMIHNFTLTTERINRSFEQHIHATEAFSRAVAATARLAAVSGGTMAQAGRAGGVLGLAGEDPASAAARARSLRERLATSPYAQAAFGTFTLPAGTGQLVNEARLFNEVSRQILFGRSAEVARMKAQVAGLEQLLPLRDADRHLTEQALSLGEMRAKMVDREMRRELGNLNALQRANEERQRIIGIGFSRATLPFFEAAERLKGAFLDVGVAAIRFENNVQKVAERWSRSPILEALFPPLAGVNALMRDRTPARKDPQAELAERIVDLAQEMSMWRRDMAGGGPRAQAAVPPGLRGMALEEGLRARALRLGAWEL